MTDQNNVEPLEWPSTVARSRYIFVDGCQELVFQAARRHWALFSQEVANYAIAKIALKRWLPMNVAQLQLDRPAYRDMSMDNRYFERKMRHLDTPWLPLQEIGPFVHMQQVDLHISAWWTHLANLEGLTYSDTLIWAIMDLVGDRLDLPENCAADLYLNTKIQLDTHRRQQVTQYLVNRYNSSYTTTERTTEMNGNKATLSISVTHETKQWVEEEAARLGINRSAYMTLLINRFRQIGFPKQAAEPIGIPVPGHPDTVGYKVTELDSYIIPVNPVDPKDGFFVQVPPMTKPTTAATKMLAREMVASLLENPELAMAYAENDADLTA